MSQHFQWPASKGILTMQYLSPYMCQCIQQWNLSLPLPEKGSHCVCPKVAHGYQDTLHNKIHISYSLPFHFQEIQCTAKKYARIKCLYKFHRFDFLLNLASKQSFVARQEIGSKFLSVVFTSKRLSSYFCGHSFIIYKPLKIIIP